MPHYGTPASTQSGEPLSQEQQELMNLASSVAAQSASAAVESLPLGFTRTAQQDVLTGQTFPEAQAQQAQQAQARQAQQAQARQAQQAQARQAQQAQARHHSGQAQQGYQTQQGQIPSFSQQVTSPQLSAFKQQQAQAQAQQQYHPAVDVIESNDEVHIFADLPGVDDESIEIEASNNTISLSAERIEAKRDDEGEPVMSERGRVMQRQIQLPSECDVDDASASWDKGVVTITLPKLETESTKSIGVE